MRQARQLTIEDLARKAKVHMVYLGDVERSKRNPTVQVLDRILTALGGDWAKFGAAIEELRRTREGFRDSR